MMESGVPAKVVQEILGHADVTLTLNTYSHVVGSTAHEQMEKINGLFADRTQTAPTSEKPSAEKPSIKKQMDEAQQQVNNNSKKPRAEKPVKKKKDGLEP